MTGHSCYYLISNNFYWVILELDNIIESMMMKRNTIEGGEWVCMVCNKSVKKKSHMQMHVEAFHIEGISHKCDFCLSIFKTRSSLKAHIWRLHKEPGQAKAW